ncbi:hypothetical protein N7468_002114 [Penicillium chermesinum]|uniref:Uncharacterized protein n=1 Tax=Penicillium chermesinum TaxID=63820 RepID=A0A9W9TX84_9EURO|nr:uncharacterized protein N7468_002114 [Penicillium chermesinum]KAJ5247131.1 hypothetical protein N7468_002114 [Penicillium chermesinum]
MRVATGSSPPGATLLPARVPLSEPSRPKESLELSTSGGYTHSSLRFLQRVHLGTSSSHCGCNQISVVHIEWRQSRLSGGLREGPVYSSLKALFSSDAKPDRADPCEYDLL